MDKWETREKNDKANVTYYYNRERRMEGAGRYARFAESLHHAKRPGLLRTMTATRPLAMLFYGLIFMLVAAFLVDWVSGGKESARLAGWSYSMDALWFEGDAYLSLRRERGLGAREAGLATVRVTVGGQAAEGEFLPGVHELKLKLPAVAKPEWAAALIVSGDSQAELAVRVR